MVYITLTIAIIGTVLSVITFFDNKKNKSNTEDGKEQYEKGKLDQQLKTILDKLDKIDKKFDGYDKEISERIETALAHHVREYHRKEK